MSDVTAHRAPSGVGSAERVEAPATRSNAGVGAPAVKGLDLDQLLERRDSAERVETSTSTG